MGRHIKGRELQDNVNSSVIGKLHRFGSLGQVRCHMPFEREKYFLLKGTMASRVTFKIHILFFTIPGILFLECCAFP